MKLLAEHNQKFNSVIKSARLRKASASLHPTLDLHLFPSFYFGNTYFLVYECPDFQVFKARQNIFYCKVSNANFS